MSLDTRTDLPSLKRSLLAILGDVNRLMVRVHFMFDVVDDDDEHHHFEKTITAARAELVRAYFGPACTELEARRALDQIMSLPQDNPARRRARRGRCGARNNRTADAAGPRDGRCAP